MFLYKSNFHWQSNTFLWFDFQTCGFTYQGGQCIVAMFSCFKTKSQRKFTTQGLCISAMSHVELITETKNMKSMRFFLQFFERYCGKFYKKCSTRNEEWIKFESATITSDYVLHNHLSI